MIMQHKFIVCFRIGPANVLLVYYAIPRNGDHPLGISGQMNLQRVCNDDVFGQQRCIVHQVRNTLKYVPDKDRKPFATDLKKIYHASNEQKGREALEAVAEKWQGYPNAIKSWFKNWDAITPIFKFSTTVRTVIYTTNAIESLNSTYRKLNRQRSVFPSDTALLKALYLATFEATKKWTMPIRNWGKIYGELAIMYEGRLPE